MRGDESAESSAGLAPASGGGAESGAAGLASAGGGGAEDDAPGVDGATELDRARADERAAKAEAEAAKAEADAAKAEAEAAKAEAAAAAWDGAKRAYDDERAEDLRGQTGDGAESTRITTKGRAAGARAGEGGAVAGVYHAVVVDPGGTSRVCLLYTSPSPRDQRGSRMPSSA